ncbi:MAG: hypothetical protein IPP81_12860 [Chitinophagaceae bacterium]|nr:hypothetical protein [Chitinophagaceae bacterium]
MNLRQIGQNVKHSICALYKNIMKMEYNHIANLKELDEKALILNGYDYSANDPHGLAEAFFQFCQTNLSEQNKQFNIQPARLYVRDVQTVNALAAKRNGYFVIGVNISTLIVMHNFFTNRQQVFENPDLAEFKLLDGKLDLPISLLMYQVCTQFTYYHELAHLIQFSTVGKNDNAAQPIIEIEEEYSQTAGTTDPYSLEKHVREFDADLHGGHFTCLHVIGYWNRLPAEHRTQDNLELLLSIGVASVFSYFIFLLRNYPDIYYKASDHPHPLVRLSYIMDQYIKTSQINLPTGTQIQPRDILKRALLLGQGIFTFGGGEDRVRVFADSFEAESGRISDYVNDVLIPQSKLMPELVMNRMQEFEKK